VFWRLAVALCAAAALSSCTTQQSSETAAVDPELGVAASPRVVAEGEEVARGGGRRHLGGPYKIAGRWYSPKEDPNYDKVGLASWYGDDFHGRMTANGEIFDSAALSAAHPTLPLPTYVRVTNLDNGASVIVRVNDRGPFSRDRLIDVSERTAELLGFRRSGTARVRVQYVDVARLDGRDEEFLLASYRRPGEAAPATMVAAASPPDPPPPSSDGAAIAFAAPGGGEAGDQAVSALTASYTPDDRIAMTFGLLGD
jgi:rare lipoprotein A